MDLIINAWKIYMKCFFANFSGAQIFIWIFLVGANIVI